jgi:hypothetical protein
MKSIKKSTMSVTERKKQAGRKIAILLARLARLATELDKCSQVAMAVKAVVGGEENGRYDDVDEHPGSLDLR